MKKILITGAKSYIGESVRDYLMMFPAQYDVQVKDTINWEPAAADFCGIDIVFNVAGIAHINETKQNRPLYYKINRDLVVKIAKTAKDAGVKQFIQLSTMAVYGMVTGHITKNTLAKPVNAYGKSKFEADEVIKKLADERFRYACLRPPMVYGKGCKGNYQRLRAFVLKFCIFPDCQNKRSMIYIGNLCEFVKKIIDKGCGGLFFPQNNEYINTSVMAVYIAKEHGKRIRLIKFFNWMLKRCELNIVKKVFGDLTYEKVDMVNKYKVSESIKLTERGQTL